jgi:hypothetical protein
VLAATRGDNRSGGAQTRHGVVMLQRCVASITALLRVALLGVILRDEVVVVVSDVAVAGPQTVAVVPQVVDLSEVVSVKR